MPTEIQQLVDECLSDDPSAMIRLVAKFRGQVFSLCYRMLGQWQDAEDAAQETFLRVVRHLGRWDSQRDFEPWLLAIAANRCRSQLARRMKRPTPEPIFDGWAADHRDLERQQAQLLAEEIDRVLSMIRPEWRQAFKLFHQSQLSYEEIAAEMKRPVGTIKTWVHRGRQEIIRQLQQRDVVRG